MSIGFSLGIASGASAAAGLATVILPGFLIGAIMVVNLTGQDGAFITTLPAE